MQACFSAAVLIAQSQGCTLMGSSARCFGFDAGARYSAIARRFQASKDDLTVYSAIRTAPSKDSHPHAARWYNHIAAIISARCAACFQSAMHH